MNEVGSLSNMKAAPPTKPRNTTISRSGRRSMPPTMRWKMLLDWSKAVLNKRNRPRCLPCVGFSMVAHSAGVSTRAVITDSSMAETMVTEN